MRLTDDHMVEKRRKIIDLKRNKQKLSKKNL